MDSWNEWSKHVLIELERLGESSDRITDQMTELTRISSENTRSLKEHMRRTEAVEENNELIRALVENHRKALDKKLAPIQRFIDRTKFLGTVLAVSGTVLIGAKKLGLLSVLFKLASLD